MNTRLPEHAYGLLLTFDGYQVPSERCDDAERLYRFLYDFPGTIGMRRLGTPHIVAVDEPGIRGLSGFMFIMESHISVHTYAEQGFVTMDVYSCKAFDTEQAIRLVAAFFATDTFHTQTLVRGRSLRESGPRTRKRDAGT